MVNMLYYDNMYSSFNTIGQTVKFKKILNYRYVLQQFKYVTNFFYLHGYLFWIETKITFVISSYVKT